MNQPPVAERIEKDLSKFGKKRIDPYYWLKDKTNSKVIDYLKAENAYKDSVMAGTKDLQKTLYEEMVGRIKEDDESYPTFKNGYYYYSRTEKGKQYRTYCRKKSLDGKEEVILDANKMAEGKPAFIFWGYFVSPDNKKLAYLYNETGSYAEFTLKFLSLETGKEIGFAQEGVDSFAWSNDSEHVFYTEIDDTLRSSKFFKRALDGSGTKLLYEEVDGKFRIGCYADTARKYVILQSNSSTTSEVYYIKDCDYNGKLELFHKREHHFDYDILPYHDYFYVRCKDDEHLNGYICKVKASDINDKSKWEVIIPTNKEELIEGFSAIEGYLMVEKRRNGLMNIFIFATDSDEKQQITFPEPVYNASFLGNPEFNSTTFRYN